MDNGIALVTGASAGLGEHFARLFAQDGHDVVLVARNGERLKKVADAVTAGGKARAHVIVADLIDRAAPQAVFDAVQKLGLAVDFLVNNAGFGSNGAFLDLPVQPELDMVDLNIRALVSLTHLFGKPMQERRRGRILNIASTAAFQPGPFMATYYATKAFVVSWSRALAYELKDSGVTVTCHCPGATATEFAQRAGNDKSRLFQRGAVAGAEETAQHAYRALMSGKRLAVHGAMNKVASVAGRMMPGASLAIAANLNRP